MNRPTEQSGGRVGLRPATYAAFPRALAPDRVKNWPEPRSGGRSLFCEDINKGTTGIRVFSPSEGATGSPSPRTTNSGRVIASRLCKRLITNAAVGTRPITADHDEHVIQADTSGAAYAVGVVKRVVRSGVKQYTVTVAGGIEIGGYNV